MTNKTTSIHVLQAEHVTQIHNVLAQSLHFSHAWMQFWLDTLGYEHYRVAHVDGRVAGGLGIIHMGQWWGGQRVPIVGITAVGVAPEYRGTGVGGALLRSVLAELRAEQVPLSVLYPSTLGFYRSVGYERAGTRIMYELPLHAIPGGDRSLAIVPIAHADRELLRNLHNHHAQYVDGRLDRAPFIWERILAPPELTIRTYAVLHENQPRGYVVFVQTDQQHQPLVIRDFCALDAPAGLRLLTFLADHRTMSPSIQWGGTLNDPFVALLPEQHANVTRMYDWMLRIVDVAGALQRRGYPPTIKSELHLEVSDAVLHENAGRYIVRVADGRAEVERGGNGSVRLDVRDLAAIYSGHRAPIELRYSGALQGSDANLVQLGLLFHGPQPRMNDMF